MAKIRLSAYRYYHKKGSLCLRCDHPIIDSNTKNICLRCLNKVRNNQRAWYRRFEVIISCDAELREGYINRGGAKFCLPRKEL